MHRQPVPVGHDGGNVGGHEALSDQRRRGETRGPVMMTMPCCPPSILPVGACSKPPSARGHTWPHQRPPTSRLHCLNLAMMTHERSATAALQESIKVLQSSPPSSCCPLSLAQLFPSSLLLDVRHSSLGHTHQESRTLSVGEVVGWT